MPTINTHKNLVETIQEAYESVHGPDSSEQVIVLADELATGRKIKVEIKIGTSIGDLRAAIKDYLRARPHAEVYQHETITVYHVGDMPLLAIARNL